MARTHRPADTAYPHDPARPDGPGHPDDLVRAQREWTRTYEALAAPRHIRHTALRRRLLRLSNRIARHPFWPEERGPGAGLAELRQRARRE